MRGRSHRGFSLIEVLVVLLVVGLMVGTVIFGFGAGRSAEVSRATNQLASTIRHGFDKARVTGDYYRMLINLEEGSFTLQAGDDKMYLPATDRDGQVLEIDEDDVRDQEARDARAADAYNRSVQSQVYEGGTGGDQFDPYAAQRRDVPRRKPPLFEGFEDENAISSLTEPFKLPKGVKIVYVRTVDDLEPVTKGEASIYFFPRGHTQLAHIHISDEENETDKYTIKVQPLTGRVSVVDGHEPLELPSSPTSEEDESGNRIQRRSL